jgi:hypothetical protein
VKCEIVSVRNPDERSDIRDFGFSPHCCAHAGYLLVRLRGNEGTTLYPSAANT